MRPLMYKLAIVVWCGSLALTPLRTQAQPFEEIGRDSLNMEARARALTLQLQNPVQSMDAEALFQMALSGNAELLATKQQITEAQGLLRQAGFRPNPGLNFNVTTGSFLGSSGERQISVGYAHTFELGGKRSHRREVAREGAVLAQQAIDDRMRLLRSEIQEQFGEALAAMRNLDIIDQLIEVTRQNVQITEARVLEGEAATLELGQLQVELDRLESDRLLVENQVERTKLTLKTLAGMDLNASFSLSGDLHVPPLSLTRTMALSSALSDRPDLQAMRLDVSRAESAAGLARSQAVPNLIGGVSYTRSEGRFDQFGTNRLGARVPLRDTDHLITATVAIALPFFNRNQGNVQASRAQYKAAQLRRQYREEVVAREVLSAYSRYEAANKALGIFDTRIVDQAQENLRIVTGAYQFGELRVTDVIIEQRRVLDIQRSYTDVLKEYNLAVTELERAVGSPLR